MRSTIARAAGFALFALQAGCGGAEMAPATPPADAPPARQSLGSEAITLATDADAKEDARLAVNRPAPAPPPPGHMPRGPAGAPPPPPPPPPAPPSTDGGSRRDAGGEVAVVRGPMLIYTAQITMAVFEVNASLSKVEAIGRDLGGFLAKRDDRSVTIRVPIARFDEAVKRVEEVGDMLHRNVTAQDVTEEFRDLEIRLKSARAVQQRLTELLARAVKVEESIAIERELDRVTGEIERIEGKMKFLRDRAAYSTITVAFNAKPKEQVGGTAVRLPVRWLYDLGLRRLLSL